MGGRSTELMERTGCAGRERKDAGEMPRDGSIPLSNTAPFDVLLVPPTFLMLHQMGFRGRCYSANGAYEALGRGVRGEYRPREVEGVGLASATVSGEDVRLEDPAALDEIIQSRRLPVRGNETRGREKRQRAKGRSVPCLLGGDAPPNEGSILLRHGQRRLSLPVFTGGGIDVEQRWNAAHTAAQGME